MMKDKAKEFERLLFLPVFGAHVYRCIGFCNIFFNFNTFNVEAHLRSHPGLNVQKESTRKRRREEINVRDDRSQPPTHPMDLPLPWPEVERPEVEPPSDVSDEESDQDAEESVGNVIGAGNLDEEPAEPDNISNNEQPMTESESLDVMEPGKCCAVITHHASDMPWLCVWRRRSSISMCTYLARFLSRSLFLYSATHSRSTTFHISCCSFLQTTPSSACLSSNLLIHCHSKVLHNAVPDSYDVSLESEDEGHRPAPFDDEQQFKFAACRMRGRHDSVDAADYYNPGSLSDRRCRMGDELLNALECCKSWQRYGILPGPHPSWWTLEIEEFLKGMYDNETLQK
jgi:hypothetical protein